MLARRWLPALSLFLVAAALTPPAAAHIAKTNPIACSDAAPGDEICAPAGQGAQPAAPVRVISVWGGARDSIALESDGSVWTWGLNSCDPNHFTTGPCGKLGDGTSTERHVPVQVHGPGNVGYLSSVTAIMGGEHDNYALKSDGTVWSWGANFVAPAWQRQLYEHGRAGASELSCLGDHAGRPGLSQPGGGCERHGLGLGLEQQGAIGLRHDRAGVPGWTVQQGAGASIGHLAPADGDGRRFFQPGGHARSHGHELGFWHTWPIGKRVLRRPAITRGRQRACSATWCSFRPAGFTRWP